MCAIYLILLSATIACIFLPVKGSSDSKFHVLELAIAPHKGEDCYEDHKELVELLNIPEDKKQRNYSFLKYLEELSEKDLMKYMYFLLPKFFLSFGQQPRTGERFHQNLTASVDQTQDKFETWYKNSSGEEQAIVRGGPKRRNLVVLKWRQRLGFVAPDKAYTRMPHHEFLNDMIPTEIWRKIGDDIGAEDYLALFLTAKGFFTRLTGLNYSRGLELRTHELFSQSVNLLNANIRCGSFEVVFGNVCLDHFAKIWFASEGLEKGLLSTFEGRMVFSQRFLEWIALNRDGLPNWHPEERKPESGNMWWLMRQLVNDSDRFKSHCAKWPSDSIYRLWLLYESHLGTLQQ